MIRPRVLYVVNEAYFFLSHRMPVARAARDAGYDVHVAAPSDHVWAPDQFHTDELEQLGFRFHAIPLSRRGTNPFADLRTLFAVARLIRDLKPDLVHLVTLKPNLYGGLAARLLNTPRVVYALTGLGHTFVASGPAAALLRRLVSATLRVSLGHRNSRIIFQNPDDRDRLVGAGIAAASRSRVIVGSGVEVTTFKVCPEPGGPPVVALCARLIWEKGIGEFVEAGRRLKAEGIAARFVLVGDTRPANPRSVPRLTLERWVEEGVIEWWGYRKDMPAVLAESSVVCLPSTYGEGVPKILLEAAASARPVVATDIPGCREAVLSGKTGYLVRPGDVESLTDALRTLVTDADLRRRMGGEARALAEGAFDQARIVKQTLHAYRELGWAGGQPED